MFRKAYLALLLALFGSFAFAASVPYLSPPWDPTNGQGSINGLIGSLNSSITPGSMAPYAMGRNFLDNGAMQVDQRSAFAVTSLCATTSGPIQATGTTAGSYASDRWACDINMATGSGQLSATRATPSPATGFTNFRHMHSL